MLDIDKCTQKLKEAILKSDEYKEYLHCLEALKREPQLYDKVNYIRRRTFYVNNNSDLGEEQYANEVMQYSAEYDELKANEIARAFLDAELVVCRIIQDINYRLVEELDLDISFMEN